MKQRLKEKKKTSTLTSARVGIKHLGEHFSLLLVAVIFPSSSEADFSFFFSFLFVPEVIVFSRAAVNHLAGGSHPIPPTRLRHRRTGLHQRPAARSPAELQLRSRAHPWPFATSNTHQGAGAPQLSKGTAHRITLSYERDEDKMN